MTLDDLLEVFDKGVAAKLAAEDYPREAFGTPTLNRAGVRAVVKALRGEMPRALSEVARQECCGNGVYNGGPQECCGIPNLMVTTDQVHDAINEILASDGVEATTEDSSVVQAAGGSTREDEKAVEAAGDKGPVSVNSPAAAPDVCVWAKESNLWTIGCDPLRFPSFVPSKKICKHCNRPISFKEAAR